MFCLRSCTEARYPESRHSSIGSWPMIAGLIVNALARTALPTVQLTTSIVRHEGLTTMKNDLLL
jgi:hypothetical protein